MAESNETQEYLVLTADEDNVFAIPWSALEQYRATPEQRTTIFAAMDDVSGYGLSIPDDGKSVAMGQGKSVALGQGKGVVHKPFLGKAVSM